MSSRQARQLAAGRFFERAVVVATEAAARVRDMEARAQQIIDGYMPGSTGDQVARYILGVL